MRLRYGLLLLLPLAASGCAREEAVPAPVVPRGEAPPPALDPAAPVTDGPVEPAPAPAFALPGLEGDFALADQRGRVVVLNFWATWNELSLEGMTALDSLHATLAGDGIVVVGITEDADALATLQAWAAAHPPPAYPLVADTAGAVARAYGGVELLPTTVVVDREGQLRARHTGILTADELLDLLGPVLIEDDEPLTATPAGAPGVVRPLSADEADALVRGGAVLVDVRAEEDRRAAGALPYALYRPAARLTPADLPANFSTPLVFADAGVADGGDAAGAAERALAWGYVSVFVLDGGVPAWIAAGLPLDVTPPALPDAPPAVPTGSVLG
jgi:peroxiredoxin/rhodanese-related sulfurtransferase